MEALKAELERKRKQKAEEFGGRKFVKRSEIEAVRKAQRAELQAPKAEPTPAGDERVTNQPTTTEVSSSSAAGGSQQNELVALSKTQKGKKGTDEEKLEPLEKAEVIRRLRALGQPATLFAESDEDRQKRLMVAAKNITVDDLIGGQQRNEMHAKLREMDAAAERSMAMRKLKKKEEATDVEAVTVDPLEAAFEAASAELARKRKAESMTVGDRITEFFRNIMDEWAKDIDKMDDDYLYTMEGKLLRATFDLTSKNMKYMYRGLKHGTLPDDVQRGLWLIVEAMQRRDYRDAMDVYLRVSIGNAPWPIGVTMVGIHERSAREKLNTNSQAHIMHDEASRKMLNGVKRCISFCQRRYPANPSRTFEFNLRVFGDDLSALHKAEERGEIVDAASRDHNIPVDKHGNRVDGWKAQDRDNRTLSAVLNSAYKHEDDVGKNYGERQIIMQ